jgi:hypothetical protein
MVKTMVVSLFLTSVIALSAYAGAPLTDVQMDGITAGDVGVTATATASADSVDAPATATTRTSTFTNGNVAVGNAFAKSDGNLTSTTTALVTPTGDMTHVESNTVTTPSGISISQSNGVAH